MSGNLHTTVYVQKKTRERVNRLVAETGYPQYVVIGLAIETLDEFFDDVEEMKKSLAIYHENRGERGRPYKHAKPSEGGAE